MPGQMECLRTALADRYRIERELGRGGTGVVYLGEDLKLGRKVALKTLHPGLATLLGGDRFLREMTLTARLEHPHILALHDSGEAAGLLYYVMPYVEGESLRDRLNREKQLPLDDALRITREVAHALESAHRHGIVHRDIKPENILLGAGHAVVSDFGIALAVREAGGERLTETGIAVGTPGYMSPEQATGEHELDGRSDIYSLGCVLYEMLAGEPLFTGPTARTLVARHLLETPPRLDIVRPSVPPRVAETIERALAKTPADRYANASQFLAALEQLAERVAPDGSDQPSGDRPTPSPFSLLRELRKRLVLHVGVAYVVFAWFAVRFTRTLVQQYAVETWVTAVVTGLLAIGLPFLLVTAWFAEPARSSPSTTRRFWQRWAARTRPSYVVSVLATLVIAMIVSQPVLDRSGTVTDPAERAATAFDPKRIAVLPFEDQSQQQEFGHLALVFPQYLIDRLSQPAALTVVPAAAVKRYYRSHIPLDSVIRDLAVGTLVEGTVIGSDSEVRIIVRLTDANRLAVIHSKEHRRPRGETLALLDELTNEVAGALRRELYVVIRNLEHMAGTDDNQAWELYARGRERAQEAKDLWSAGATDPALRAYERADSAFVRAQAADPRWADPIVEQGWATYEKARILERDLRSPDPEMLRHGIALAERALALAPQNARALDLRGSLRYWLRETVNDDEAVSLREGAERDLRASTRIDPTNAHAWRTLANVLRTTGEHAEAKQAAERALGVDRVYEERGNDLARLCHTSLENREWGEVERWCNMGRREFPQNAIILNVELLALASAGGPEPDVTKTWGLFEDFVGANPPQRRAAVRPSALLYVAAALARAGMADSSKAVMRLARAAESAPDPMNDYNEAHVWLLLGDEDQALRLLRRHLQAKPGRKEYIARAWWWEPLRRDLRFLDLVR